MNKDNNSKRLLSLDTLRGFDMLFIMGLSGLIVNLAALAPDSAFASWFALQMKHVAWDGFAHHDTIFPLFLFIAGVSLPLSVAKQFEQGATRRDVIVKIIRRAAVLVILGILYNGFFKMQFDTLRIPSVLGRIGIAWACASLMTLYLKPKVRIAICAVILIGYSLLLTIPAPDAVGVDVWTKEGNIAGYIDRLIIPNHILWRGVMDPEGFLSNIPAIVTAMLGIFTGEYISKSNHSGGRKAATLALCAVVLLITALIWNAFQPINKTLWSSAFVLAAGAYSVGMFALFYYIIDVLGWHRWTYFFKVVGVNSITIYLAQRFIGFSAISKYFFGGLASHLPEGWSAVIISVGYITACWLLLWFLDRQKIYLKV